MAGSLLPANLENLGRACPGWPRGPWVQSSAKLNGSGCSILQGAWQNIHRLQTIRQDIEEFFLIKISVRFNSFFLPCIPTSECWAGISTIRWQHSWGRDNSAEMDVFICYPSSRAHAGAGRFVGIREQICMNEVQRVLQWRYWWRKTLRNYSTSAFHKYPDTLVRKNQHQCFLCKCSKTSKQQHKTAFKWVKMMSKSHDT